MGKVEALEITESLVDRTQTCSFVLRGMGRMRKISSGK